MSAIRSLAASDLKPNRPCAIAATACKASDEFVACHAISHCQCLAVRLPVPRRHAAVQLLRRGCAHCGTTVVAAAQNMLLRHQGRRCSCALTSSSPRGGQRQCVGYTGSHCMAQPILKLAG